jgi:uncharacterized membrane protein
VLRHRYFQVSAWVLSLVGYIWLGYFTQRTDYVQVISLYSVLFILYVVILYGGGSAVRYRTVIGGAILLRLSLILVIPNLSDDFYRYIWDGLLTADGLNPYMLTPAELASSEQAVPGISAELYQNLNSPGYLSAYPPVSQFVFWVSAKLAGASILGNIVALRGIILLAELGTLMLLHGLAVRFKLTPGTVLIYAINPLVIVELTGNLHLEAVMIFFLLLSVYLLVRERQFLSAATMGLAIGTKLMPLILLPLLLKRLGIGRSLRFYLVAGAVVLLAFTPFMNGQSVSNYLSSLALYFRVFEFNASAYYLVKWAYYQTSSGTLISIAQMLLPVITLLAVIAISVKQRVDSRQSLFVAALFSLVVYFLLTNNVHPWNLTPLVMLSAFTGYRFVLVWSWGVVLTYSAYRTFPYSENLWLVAFEYLLVLAWMARETVGYHVRRSRTQEIGREE